MMQFQNYLDSETRESCFNRFHVSAVQVTDSAFLNRPMVCNQWIKRKIPPSPTPYLYICTNYINCVYMQSERFIYTFVSREACQGIRKSLVGCDYEGVFFVSVHISPPSPQV